MRKGSTRSEPPSLLQRRFERLAARADIRVDPPTDRLRAHDVIVNDPRLFRRVALGGFTGLADAYVDGWWDCGAVDRLACRALQADLPARLWLNPTVLTRGRRPHGQ